MDRHSNFERFIQADISGKKCLEGRLQLAILEALCGDTVEKYG
jgi:hypothetical protein